jgi:Dual specificity phosphatase, catalytic domain
MRREERVAIWVHGKSTFPSLRVRSGQALSQQRDTGGTPKLPQRKVHRRGMDITWLTERIAVGGGIWTADNMAAVAKTGITHIIDMQIEFDDTPLAAGLNVEVLWNPTDDDFEPKPPRLFRRGVEFALRALEWPEAKVFIHCAAGVHRAPMMALAVLGSMGWELEDAMQFIEGKRPVADFAEVYVESVEKFLEGRARD